MARSGVAGDVKPGTTGFSAVRQKIRRRLTRNKLQLGKLPELLKRVKMLEEKIQR